MTRARLLKRVFDIDIEQCQCGGKLKLIAVIEEPDVIEKMLKHIEPESTAAATRKSSAGGFVWGGLSSIGWCLPAPRKWFGPRESGVRNVELKQSVNERFQMGIWREMWAG